MPLQISKTKAEMQQDSNVKSMKGQESQDAVKLASSKSLEASFRGKKSKHFFNKRWNQLFLKVDRRQMETGSPEFE